ncbi:MAG: hypothetical protein KBS95_01260 [Alistipes sp.]|nr:hypothetical protein [Candidatus Alistipes equi]
MKKTFLLLATILIAVLFSCTKTGFEEQDSIIDKTILGVTHANLDTKTYLGEGVTSRPILWKAGDKIIVNKGDMKGAPGLVSQEYDGKASAIIPLESYMAAPFNVLYPAEVMAEDGTILLDEVQSFVSNNVASGTAISAGYSMSDDISLKCLCGFIKFTITQQSDEEIESLTISSIGGKAMSGIFDIDYNTPSMTCLSGKDFIRIENVSYTNGKAEIIATIPAGTYEGFRVRIRSNKEKNNMMQAHLTKNASTVDMLGGTMVDLGVIPFNPNSSAKEITTAQQFQQFLNDVSLGDYTKWVDEKSGEVLLGSDIDFAGADIVSATASFAGILNGQGYALKNTTFKQAIFTNLTGTIKNIVLDETCTIIFPSTSGTKEVRNAVLVEVSEKGSVISGCVCKAICPKVNHTTVGRHFFGIFAARSYGLLQNCINYTDVDLEFSNMDATIDMGLLVGATRYAYCSVEECVNFGDFTLTILGKDNNVYMGGIVGVYTASNVEKCINHGNITYNYSSSGTGLPYVGGVSGANGSTSACVLTSCANYGNVTLSSSGKVYRPYVGGVIGSASATITSCRNEGCVKVVGTYAQKTVSDVTYYPSIGGIVGINGDADHARTIAGCENGGDVLMESTPASATYSRGGGIAGLNYGTTMECLNKGNIHILDCGKDHYAAGIVGITTGIVCTIKNCRNEGTISGSTTAGTNCSLLLGGIVGRERGAEISSCTNVGEIHADGGQINAGGIVGMLLIASTHSISDCVNDGSIITYTSNSTSTDISARVGGIVGYAGKYKTEYTISGCTNNADINVTNGGSNSYYRVGGIIGYGTRANISNCVNNGMINVKGDDTYSCTKTQYVGGIVGYPCNDDGYEIIGLKDCINNAKVEDLSSSKVYIGGLAGANFIELPNPGRNYGEVYAKNAAQESAVGGIAGYNASTISNAWVQCKVHNGSSNNVYTGGVVGTQNASADILGGYVNVDVSTTNTGFVGLIVGNQYTATTKIGLGSPSGKIMLSEQCLVQGKKIGNPPTKQELVGNIKEESLIEINGIGTAVPTTGLISYDDKATVIAGRGGDGSLFISVGDEDVDITMTPSGWIRFSSTTPSSALAGTAISLSYNAIANMMENERKSVVRIQGKTSGQYQDIVFTQQNGDWLKTNGAVYALPARWVNGSTARQKNADLWNRYGYYESAYGNMDANKTGGYITYVRADENEALCPLQRSIYENGPALSNLAPGDYWLIVMPDVTAEAGTWFEFYATLAGAKKSSKYFVMEWKDGDEWKCLEDRLFAAAENPSLKYSYAISGDGISHCSTFECAFPITKALQKQNLYIRLRPVGTYAADGSTHNINNTVEAESGFMYANYAAAYVNKLVGPRPSVRKKVLFIGNSLTFYYNTIAKTKQLCWTQGVEIDAYGYLHGGAVFYEHMDWDFSKYVMALGGYDYAILQCGARSIGRYGRYISPSGSDIDADEINTCKKYLEGYDDIQNWVKKYSPNCQIILEQDWRTKSNATNYVSDYNIQAEGYTISEANRMKVCDIYIDRGHAQWAKLYPMVWESPVGDSFRYVWDVSNWGYNLYYTDSYHENNDGAYLKSCVNTLMLCGKKKFTSSIISIDAVDDTVAKNLQYAAEHAVAPKTYFE